MLLPAALLALLAAAPFWEATPPQAWTEAELQELFTDSPWAQVDELSPPVQIYLATAEPMRLAETERARRAKSREPLDPDYLDFLREDHGQHIVLAIYLPNTNGLADAAESRQMEQECIMKTGRKKSQITGHFPPTPGDPYLRLVYNRPDASEKKISFELYLPGLPVPYRQVEFNVKDMVYRGKPTY